jgi:3-methyladenine DNA glycosylase AlkD
MTNTAEQVITALMAEKNPEKARFLQHFFKTGPGQYGAGDQFLGLTVPQQRAIAHKLWKMATLEDISALLQNPFHEVRLTALVILVKLTEKNPQNLAEHADFYLKHSARINNWDLVDLSAPNVVGAWMLQNPAERKRLPKLAASKLLWDRRIAVLATFPLLKAGESAELFALADQLLDDSEDLMHKAVGWMLRELGKRNWTAVEKFLRSNLTRGDVTKPRYQWLPRTTLRYCLEHQPKPAYLQYLHGTMSALN